jgi:uncharacterized protein YoxC
MSATENKTTDTPPEGNKSNGITIAVLIVLIALIGLVAAQTLKLQKLSRDVDGLKSGLAGLTPPCAGVVDETAAPAREPTCGAGPPAPAAPPQCGESLVDGLRREVAALRSEVEALKKERPNANTATAAAAPATEPETATPKPSAGMSREAIQAELAALDKRIETLKADVVKRESKLVRQAKGLQGHITEVKEKIDRTEKTVKQVRATVDKAALPELRNALEQTRRSVAQVEAQMRKLSRDAAEYGKAVETIYKQVFYNDPREQQRQK